MPLQLSLDNPSGSPLTLPEEAKQAPASPKVNLALATARESEIQLQQALASLEAKLSAAEEEKVRIKSVSIIIKKIFVRGKTKLQKKVIFLY